jgi:hypothetical protein
MPPEDQELTPPAMSAEEARELESLRAKNKELLDELKPLKRKVREIPDGVDVGALLKFKEETERQKLESKGDYDKAREQLQAQYDRDIAARDARIAELETKVRDLELITPAASVLSTIVHDPDDVFKTGRLKPDQIEAGTDGPVVVDGLTRTPLADWAKAHLPAHYLKAPKPVGSGAPAGGSSGGLPVGSNVKNPFMKPHFSLAEQGRLYKSNPALYAQLKAAAEAALR